MSENDSFFVSAYDEPVQLTIHGRACFQNARPVDEFFQRMIAQGRKQFVVDFEECTGMDSTFLGILAGAGIRLMEGDPPGRMILVRLSERNRELVENLGLDQIVELGETEMVPEVPEGEALAAGEKVSSSENAKMVLKAHENLILIDPSNKEKFQDVIEFLKNQVEE